MTIEISEIVDVEINIQDRVVSQAGFGTMLILGKNATFTPERHRYYASPDEVADDFDLTDEEYLAAVAAFNQSPQVERVAIGKRAAAVAQVQLLDFSADFITGNVINLKVGSVAMAPVTFAIDHPTTAAALDAALEAFASIGSVVVAGNNFTINAAVAGVPFVISNVVVTGGASQPTSTVTTTVANHGIGEDLDEIEDGGADWYYLQLAEGVDAERMVAAAYVESRRKVFANVTDDTASLAGTTTDMAALLEALGYNRTYTIFNGDASKFAEAAWTGRVAPDEPGTSTWMFKPLTGIVADNITSNQLANAKSKNLNVYVSISGIDMTMTGKMASGRFIDVTVALQDYLQAKLEEAIFAVLANAKKVPFTDAGIAMVTNAMYGVLNEFVTKGILADDPRPVVTVPKAASVSSANRAARLLPDVTFTARGAGALHNVQINGTITL